MFVHLQCMSEMERDKIGRDEKEKKKKSKGVRIH